MMGKARRAGRKYGNPIPTTVGDLSTILKVIPRFIRNREERTPRTPPGPFRTDPRVFATGAAGGLRVTWMGHSSMLLELDGTRVLIDPVWDERASPVEWFGPKRFFAPPLALEDLPPIDVVLTSHDHYDHLGVRTVRRLVQLPALAGARWVTGLGVGAILRGFGVPAAAITELNWTESTRVGGLELTALPARHFSGRAVWNRFHTLWSAWVLNGPRHRVLYGADSGEWAGFREIGERWGPFDLTMLEIGAYDPLWADIHMGPEGALRMFGQLGGRARGDLLMPIHWGLFDLALHGWRQPIERMWAEPGIKLWSPEPGLPTEVVPGVEVRSEWWR